MKKWLAVLPVALAVAVTTVTPSISLAKSEPTKKYGQIAYEHVQHLSEKIGPRVGGTAQEKAASEYLSQELKKLGFNPKSQPFSFVSGGQMINSQNVVGERKGKSTKQLIIGAHYDSVTVGKGADDNGSSVGVILETLAQLKQKQTPYTLKVVFFGSEEKGLRGGKSLCVTNE